MLRPYIERPTSKAESYRGTDEPPHVNSRELATDAIPCKCKCHREERAQRATWRSLPKQQRHIAERMG